MKTMAPQPTDVPVARSARIWLITYLAIALLHLIAILIGWFWIATFTKPLLMPTLLVYFLSLVSTGGRRRWRAWAVLALLAAWLGDSFLLLANFYPAEQLFFLLGLGSFLITQLTYTTFFINWPDADRGILLRRPWLALPLLAYLAMFLWLLWPGIDPALRLPVAVYGLAITSMVAAAVNLKGLVPFSTYLLLLAGVLLFLFSDTLIGLTRFGEGWDHLSLNSFLIMLTYISAQALIARQLATMTQMAAKF